jgi:hypothetical protein
MPTPVDNAQVLPQNKLLLLRDRVRISCNTGYLISQTDERSSIPVCQANGSFSPGAICR